jgi:hypothetical protein
MLFVTSTLCYTLHALTLYTYLWYALSMHATQAMLAQSQRHALSSKLQCMALQKRAHAHLYVTPHKTARVKQATAVRNDLALLGASLLQAHFAQPPAAAAAAATAAAGGSSNNTTSAPQGLAALLPAPVPVAAAPAAAVFSEQQLQQQQAVLAQCEAAVEALNNNEIQLIKKTAIKGSRQLAALCRDVYDAASADLKPPSLHHYTVLSGSSSSMLQ